MVAPTGNSVKEAWEAAVEARSGTAKITLFDASQNRVQVAGEVKNLNYEGIIEPKDANRLSRERIIGLFRRFEARRTVTGGSSSRWDFNFEHYFFSAGASFANKIS